MADRTGELKTLVFREVDRCADKLLGISDTIHQNPEVGLKEYRACELLTAQLSQHGFETRAGIAGMETERGKPMKRPSNWQLMTWSIVHRHFMKPVQTALISIR